MRKKLTIIITTIWLILLLGPFLVPIPPLKDTLPAQSLADADSRFIEVNGISLHYKTYGQGEPVFILLHGFGASVFSWREVMQPLATHGTVIAFDRPAFGLTERPMRWEGDNPYSPEFQVQLVTGLMDELQIERAILVGNSAGGRDSNADCPRLSSACPGFDLGGCSHLQRGRHTCLGCLADPYPSNPAYWPIDCPPHSRLGSRFFTRSLAQP